MVGSIDQVFVKLGRIGKMQFSGKSCVTEEFDGSVHRGLADALIQGLCAVMLRPLRLIKERNLSNPLSTCFESLMKGLRHKIRLMNQGRTIFACQGQGDSEKKNIFQIVPGHSEV